jgi:divalent metal cation (Fe/Co/Zn/Cd) transporter
VGIFIGGFGAAVAETLQTALHPAPTGFYLVGYIVLAIVIILDAVALAVGLRPLRRRANDRRMRLAEFLWRGTDPAVTTVVVSSVAGLAGGLVAAIGLAGLQLTGKPVADVAASALIGLILLAASVVLLHTNRELLTGCGVSPALVARMRDVVAGQAGVVSVPDLFAIVVGPSSLIVDDDVVFDDALDVPKVEGIIVAAAAAMRHQWPSVAYVLPQPGLGASTQTGRSNLPDR